MNGHASLHIVADTLKDLHPFYEKPPLKRNVQSEVRLAGWAPIHPHHAIINCLYTRY